MSKSSKLIKNFIKSEIKKYRDPITHKLERSDVNTIAENTSDFILKQNKSKIIKIFEDPIWKRTGLSYYCGDTFSDFKDNPMLTIIGSTAYAIAARAFMGEARLEKLICAHADGAVCMQLINFKFTAGEPIPWKQMVLKQDHRIISKCNSHAPYNILKWGFDNNIKNMTSDTRRKTFDSMYKKAYTFPHPKETIDIILAGIKNEELPCTPSQIIHSIKKNKSQEYLNNIMNNIAGLNKDQVFELYPPGDYSALMSYLIKTVDRSKLPFYIILGNHFPKVKQIIQNIMNGSWA